MSINEVMNWTVDLKANTTQFMKDLNDAAKGINIEFDNKGLVKSFAGAQGDIQKLLSNTVAAGATAGFSHANVKALSSKMEVITGEIEKSLKDIFNLQVKGSTEAAKVWGQTVKDAHAKALEGEKAKLEGAERRFALEKKNAERLIKRRQSARQDADRLEDRNASERAKDWMESIGGSVAKLKSGDLAGVLSGAGKGAAARGVGMQDKAAAAGDAGGMMGKMGGLMAKIGPIIAGIGAVVAGFAALAAIVVLVDGAVKGLNKTMMDSGVAGADMANQFNQLGNTMDNIRKSAKGSFGFNQIWGVSGKDHLEILGAFNAAGQTIHEMGTEMDRLRQYTQAALTYSKLLGLSTTDVSSSTAVYMEELGMTLEGVSGRFSNITAAAKESGFGVKRFFNMVLQATSGMSMYNVRLEEAAGLLIQLGKILGEKMGGDFLATLMKGFKDEGTQDRIKKTISTGVEMSSRVLRKDAVASAEEFQRKLTELSDQDSGKGAAVAEILSRYQLDPTDAEGFAKKLGKMAPQELGMITQELAAQGGQGEGMARSMTDLATKGQAFRGDLAGAQAALSSAGGGATLFLQLNEASRVLGKSLDQIDLSNMEQRAAFESITGKSGEAAEQLRRMGMGLRGKFDLIQKANEGGTAGREAYNKSGLAKSFGVFLDEQGKMYRLDAEKNRVDIGDSLEDLFIGIGKETLGNETAQKAEDILLAREIAKNTTDIASILERGIEWLLSGIYDSVQRISGLMGGLSADEKRGKIAALATLGDESTAAMQMAREAESDIADLKRSRSGSTPEKQADIDIKIKAREDDLIRAEMQSKSLLRQTRKIERKQDDWGIKGTGTKESQWLGFGKDDEYKYIEKDATALMGQERMDAEFRAPGAERALANPDLQFNPNHYGEGMAAKLTQRATNSQVALDLKEWLADPEATRRADDQRVLRQTTAEETAISTQTTDLVSSWKDWQKEMSLQEVSAVLAGAGIEGDTDQMAASLLRGQVPKGLDLGAKTAGGMSLYDRLSGSNPSSEMARALFSAEQGGPRAEDFLMQIGTGGRVKFAQRISASDTVTATASKPGGPIQSSGRKGSGGSTVVINSFGNAAEVVRGIQAAVAAGVV